MDVMDEMSMNNNFNEMLGVSNQNNGFPIDTNLSRRVIVLLIFS
jgi:hypothetical protein